LGADFSNRDRLGRRGIGLVMPKSGSVSSRADEFRQRAAHCDHMASQAKDLDAKCSFAEASEQWRELARVIEKLERMEPPQSN
jgi:hypothetical protein